MSAAAAAAAGAPLFVALYDFREMGDNQLALRRGDRVSVLGYNKTGEWSEARLVSSTSSTAGRGSKSTTTTGAIGWVPSLYLAPLNTLDQHAWWHGKLSRADAENMLGSGMKTTIVQ